MSIPMAGLVLASHLALGALESLPVDGEGLPLLLPADAVSDLDSLPGPGPSRPGPGGAAERQPAGAGGREASGAGLPLVHGKRYELELGGLLQTYYEYDRLADGGSHAFALNGARLNLSGSFAEQFRVWLNLDFFHKGRGPALLDAYVAWAALGEALVVVAGQFLPATTGDTNFPFWQFIRPANKGEALAWEERDRGLAVHGRLWRERLFYEALVVNGAGYGTSYRGLNDNQSLRAGGLLRLEPLGALSIKQWDLDHGPWRPGVGLAAYHSRDPDRRAGFADKLWLSADATVRGRGLYARLTTAWLGMQPGEGRPAPAAAGQVYYSAQAGYALRLGPEMALEPVARYMLLDPDRATPGDQERWLVLGANWFVHRELLRVRVNYTLKLDQGWRRAAARDAASADTLHVAVAAHF